MKIPFIFNTDISCTRCHKMIPTNIEHRCLYEILDFIADEITQLKETQCGNSGLNWRDHYEFLKNEITTSK